MDTASKHQKDSQENLTPFIEKKVKCPVCGEESLHIFLKDRTFVIERREEDGFISKYYWVKPEYSRYNLHQYFFWHCVHCKFTEEKSTFLKPPQELTLRQKYLIKRYRSLYQEDPVINHLSRYIRYPYTDFLSQVSLHYLAIYIQQFIGEHEADFLKIARFYHRLYWMFQAAESPTKPNDRTNLVEEYLEYYKLIQSNFVNGLASLEELHQWLDKQIRLEKEQGLSGWINFEEQLGQLYKTMIQHMDDILMRLNEYDKIGSEMRKIVSSESGDQLSTPFHEYGSYIEFLQQVTTYWPTIPLDKQAVIRSAIEAYQDIIRNKILEDKKLKLFQVFKYVIHFYLKLQDYENAFYMTQRLLDKANAFRDAAERRLKRLQVIQDDRVDSRLLAEYIQKTEEVIHQYSLKRDSIQEAKIENDYKKAREIYLNNRNLSLDELRALLLQSHIDDSIVNKICEEKKKESKKGIFQIFKF